MSSSSCQAIEELCNDQGATFPATLFQCGAPKMKVIKGASRGLRSTMLFGAWGCEGLRSRSTSQQCIEAVAGIGNVGLRVGDKIGAMFRDDLLRT